MFQKIAQFIIRFRIPVLIIILTVTVYLALQFRGVRILTNLDDFVPQGHPNAKVQKMIENTFQGGDMVQVAILAKKGDVINVETLQKVLRITRKIYNMEGVIPPRLASLFDIKTKLVRGNPDGWSTLRLIKAVPTKKEELEALRANLRSDELLYGRLISTDWKAILIRAEFKDVDYVYLFKQFKELVEKEKDANTEIYFSGRPILLGWIDYYQRKLLNIFYVAIILMAILLYVAFRNMRGVIFPLFAGMVSVMWGLGLLGMLGFKLDPMAAVMPFLILAIGVSHSVQIMKRYYEEISRNPDAKEVCTKVIAVLAAPALTAIITDAAAFATIMTVKIKMLQTLAVIGTLSLFSITFNVLVLIPICLSFLKPPKKIMFAAGEEAKRTIMNRILTRVAILSTQKKGAWLLLGGFSILLIIGMIGTAKMQIGGRAPGAGAFYEDAPYSIDTKAIGEKFPGAISYYIVFEGAKYDAIKNPQLLRDIEALQLFLHRHPKVGGSLSLVDYLKRMAVVTHDGDERLYKLPEIGEPKLGYCEDEKRVRDIVAAYMYLYSQGVPEEFNFIMTYDYRSTNLEVFLKDMEADTIKEIIQTSKDFVDQNWKTKEVKVHIAGGLAGVVGAINEELRSGQITNMIQISLIVFLCCALMLKSWVGATIIMVSLFTRIIVTYGVMGFTNIPLSMYTEPIASMGIGIGVDYVIYVIARIQEELALTKNNDIQEATINALNTTGRAVFYTVSAVVIGGVIFVLSPLKFQMELGTMMAVIIGLNGLGAIALISPIVYLLKPKFIFRRG